jgi:hypothetical protein
MKAVIVDMSNPRWIRVLGVSPGKKSRLLWQERKLWPDDNGAEWPLVRDILIQHQALN